MLLRLLKPCSMFSPGAEVNFPRPVAELLIQRGVARLVGLANMPTARKPPKAHKPSGPSLKSDI